MSSHLNKELRTKYDVRSVPVRKGDVVKVMRGAFKGREGKVITVYRKKWAVHIEKLTREKTNGKQFLASYNFRVGTQVQIPLAASNLLITSLKIDKNRKEILERKKRVTKEKNKHKEGLAGLDWAVSSQEEASSALRSAIKHGHLSLSQPIVFALKNLSQIYLFFSLYIY